MDDDNRTELRSSDELEQGIMMGVELDELKGENWVKYSIIRQKLNINITLSENLHSTVDKDDSWVTNGKYQHVR